MDRSLSLPMELPEAVAAQIGDARDRLLSDAAASGMPGSVVDDAIADAVHDLRDAHVHAFIGVLVERQVREALGLRALQPGNG